MISFPHSGLCFFFLFRVCPFPIIIILFLCAAEHFRYFRRVFILGEDRNLRIQLKTLILFIFCFSGEEYKEILTNF